MNKFLKKTFKVLTLIYVLITFSIGNSQMVHASLNSQIRNEDQNIYEYLRIHVPSEFKQAWLNAEKESWEPWLKKQTGFLNRQILWNKDKEEAILLINWSNRKYWKTIPKEEIDRIQIRFEEIARIGTGQRTGNPFPLLEEGEMLPQ